MLTANERRERTRTFPPATDAALLSRKPKRIAALNRTSPPTANTTPTRNKDADKRADKPENTPNRKTRDHYTRQHSAITAANPR